jgi:hypothetical protein
VVDADLRLPEAGGVIEPVRPRQDSHFFPHFCGVNIYF